MHLVRHVAEAFQCRNRPKSTTRANGPGFFPSSGSDFSSQGELIVFQSSRRPYVSVSKHEYLRNQLADRNQIFLEATFGGRKAVQG